MDDLAALLQKIYKDKAAAQIIRELPSITPYSSSLESNWHKHTQIYVTYPFSFCDKECTFVQLADKITYIKNLGFDCIHVLPPFESPLIDNGFDVADFLTIRQELGGNEAFNHFLERVTQKGMAVFIDLVLNHVSNTHEWFQKAIAGDAYYRDYFYWQSDPPKYIETVTHPTGLFGRYQIGERVHELRIIFPDQVGAIPHWIQAADGNWYFHMFYPQQLDLNWHNPNVFSEFAHILLYWSQKGLSFRLDAVTHIGKRWEDGMQSSTPATHAIIQAFHHLLELSNPGGVFLVEANVPMEILKSYGGNEQYKEADLVYNFKLAESLWIALTLFDLDQLWDTIWESNKFLELAQWVTFLRNHDALTIRHCPESTKRKLCDHLALKGKRIGSVNSVAGRTASFLDNNPQRIIMAHFLLASLPGSPALIYGDELGKPNDFEYMREQYDTKKKLGQTQTVTHDDRDINRGYLDAKDFDQPEAKQMYHDISLIFKQNQAYPEVATSCPTRIENLPNGIFGATYLLSANSHHILINLTSEAKEVPVLEGNAEVLINGALVQSDRIHLPPYGGIWLVEHEKT